MVEVVMRELKELFGDVGEGIGQMLKDESGTGYEETPKVSMDVILKAIEKKKITKEEVEKEWEEKEEERTGKFQGRKSKYGIAKIKMRDIKDGLVKK